jgi:hypothetical protein
MTPRDRRALRLGAVVVVTLVAATRVGPASARAVIGYRDSVQERAHALARTAALVAATPAMRDSLRDALSGVVGLAPQLVAGQTRADAGATLASLVSAMATSGALRLARVESLTDSPNGQPREVWVRAELEGDVRGVVRFLRRVESGEPLLTVREFALTAPDPAASAEVLRLEITIGGWYWARSEP